MNPATTVRLIVVREVMDRLRNKVYLFGTLFLGVVVFGLVLVPGMLSGEGPELFRLGVVGSVPSDFAQRLDANAAARGTAVALVALADRETAAAAVTEGEVDAALLDAGQLLADGVPHGALRDAVETALRQAETAADLKAAGLSEAEVAAALSPGEPLPVIGPDGARETDVIDGQAIAFAATILLFFTVTINAGSLLSGAVEEKSSRVVEVLLASVRPWQLLTAKVIALTGLAIAQVGVLVGAGLTANAIAGTAALPPATTATAATALLMLVLGFAFYAALYTVAGSLASTPEDAQGSSGPLMFLVLGAYFLVVFAVLPDPRGVGAQVLTFLPPTAPFTVPARVALGAIPLWQVALASAVTLAGAALTVRLASRLYAASLLAGGKLTWRDAWRGERIA